MKMNEHKANLSRLKYENERWEEINLHHENVWNPLVVTVLDDAIVSVGVDKLEVAGLVALLVAVVSAGTKASVMLKQCFVNNGIETQN